MLNVQEILKTRAYFVHEEQREHGILSDPESDWAQAKWDFGICNFQIAPEAEQLARNRRAAGEPDDPKANWLEAEQRLLKKRLQALRQAQSGVVYDSDVTQCDI